jgi:hypothetical protein
LTVLAMATLAITTAALATSSIDVFTNGLRIMCGVLLKKRIR